MNTLKQTKFDLWLNSIQKHNLKYNQSKKKKTTKKNPEKFFRFSSSEKNPQKLTYLSFLDG